MIVPFESLVGCFLTTCIRERGLNPCTTFRFVGKVTRVKVRLSYEGKLGNDGSVLERLVIFRKRLVIL